MRSFALSCLLVFCNYVQSQESFKEYNNLKKVSAIADFQVNEANLAAALERNPILVTAMNSVIGYDKGAEIAKKAYAEGRSVREVAAELTDLTDAELDRLLDPAELTKGGIKG